MEMITERELSERWKVSIRTLKRYRKEGVLPNIRIGMGKKLLVRYDVDTIEKIEKKGKVK